MCYDHSMSLSFSNHIRATGKRVFVNMLTAKAKIRLRIRAVWSGSSLSDYKIIEYCGTEQSIAKFLVRLYISPLNDLEFTLKTPCTQIKHLDEPKLEERTSIKYANREGPYQFIPQRIHTVVHMHLSGPPVSVDIFYNIEQFGKRPAKTPG